MPKTAVIKVYDEIGGWGLSFADFDRQLSQATGDVEIHIHSPGGDAWEGMAMSNAIRAYDRGKVVAVIDGLCASAAGFLAAAADERAMHAQALFMVHEASCFAFGRKAELLDAAGRLDDVNRLQAEGFSKLTGKPLDEIMALLAAETWYTPAEAKSAGFVDRVIEIPARGVEPRTMAQFVARFRNAPAEWQKLAAPFRAAASAAAWQPQKQLKALSEPPTSKQPPKKGPNMQSRKDLIGVMCAALSLALATAQEAKDHADEELRKVADSLLDDDALPKAMELIMPLAQAEKLDEESKATASALFPVYNAAKRITGASKGVVGALEALKKNADGKMLSSVSSQCDALIREGVAALKILPTEGEQYKAAVLKGERSVDDMEAWIKASIPRGAGSSEQVQENAIKTTDPKAAKPKEDDSDEENPYLASAQGVKVLKGA